jgi:uncharacterized Rmd1/YagE family protein
MPASPLSGKTEFKARTLLLGERLDLRSLGTAERLAMNPLTMRVEEGGVAVLFRFGAVVLFDVADSAQASFLRRTQPLVLGPYQPNETEEVGIRIDAHAAEGVDAGKVCLRNDDIERLQIVADVLSKSVVLSMYESKVAESFDRVEPFAIELEQHGRSGRYARELLRHIGGALLSEHRMAGRVELGDKPDLVWERPDLEHLYLRVADEFEIRERHLALERKLNLIARTAQTIVQLLQHRRSLRVEWYIVALIVIEIALTLYELFLRG